MASNFLSSRRSSKLGYASTKPQHRFVALPSKATSSFVETPNTLATMAFQLAPRTASLLVRLHITFRSLSGPSTCRHNNWRRHGVCQQLFASFLLHQRRKVTNQKHTQPLTTMVASCTQAPERVQASLLLRVGQAQHIHKPSVHSQPRAVGLPTPALF
jgi:hypothetical protein